jgi:hypothetical protein
MDRNFRANRVLAPFARMAAAITSQLAAGAARQPQRGVDDIMSVHRKALLLVSGAMAAALIAAGTTGVPAWAQTAARGAVQTAQAETPVPGSLALTGLSFAQSSVDATSGTATVNLNWTVTDSNPSATDVAGAVYIRMAGSHPGTYIGMPYEATYDLTGALNTCCVQGNPTGSVQDASFSYSFAVPQYANAATASWVVSQVTVQDDQGDTLTLAWPHLNRFHASLTATELVDSTPPTYDSLMLANADERPYAYNNGVNGSITYYLEVLDAQSGFWQGRLTLHGPDGQTVHENFGVTYQPIQQAEFCGGTFDGYGIINDALCTVTVTFPPGAAAGTWSVSKISITDNAGNTAVFRNLDSLPITLTANQVVTASGFSASPNPVNDWQDSAPWTLSFNVSGAVDGISAVYVDAIGCPQSGGATVSGDTVSVPMFVFIGAQSCTVSGIAIVDGAGNVALYGSEYGAPSPGVTITQEPDTPPVITSASLSPASVPESTSAQTLTLNVTTGNILAPVADIVASLYDSSGNQVSAGDADFEGNLDSNTTEQLQFTVPANLAPGVYTVGLLVEDDQGLGTTYGPDGQAMPGGPVQLTVTSS